MTKKVWWGIAAGVVVLAALLLYISDAGSLLGARLVGPDVASAYTPLVRHLLASQTHCYDQGDLFCERLTTTGGQKEFTVAYLFTTKPRGLEPVPLIGCYNSQNMDYVTTTSEQDCRNRGLRPRLLGYMSKTDAFESSVELIECYNKSSNNYILTDDRRECELASHTDHIQRVGYVASAGHLPQRRLNELCAAIANAGVLAQSHDALCRNLNTD